MGKNLIYYVLTILFMGNTIGQFWINRLHTERMDILSDRITIMNCAMVKPCDPSTLKLNRSYKELPTNGAFEGNQIRRVTPKLRHLTSECSPDQLCGTDALQSRQRFSISMHL